VTELDDGWLATALASPDVQGGMRAKLAAAQLGIAAGIGEIWIAAWQGEGTLAALANGTAVGTRIHGGRASASKSGVCA
jgi:glutamate 5-kinase